MAEARNDVRSSAVRCSVSASVVVLSNSCVRAESAPGWLARSLHAPQNASSWWAMPKSVGSGKMPSIRPRVELSRSAADFPASSRIARVSSSTSYDRVTPITSTPYVRVPVPAKMPDTGRAPIDCSSARWR